MARRLRRTRVYGSDIFGKTFECPCGRTHSIRPGEVVYAADVFDRLAELCSRAAVGRRVAVLVDVRTKAAAGDAVGEALSAAGWRVEQVLLEDPAPGCWPICDDHTRHVIEPKLLRSDLILPVGSGVISDLGKWVAVDAKMPFVAFATAASMNGYASSNIAPTIGGLKSVIYAQAPVAVASAPAVLRDAPYELTAAGLGDVLAKSVSSADWYMNHLLFDDYYCERSVGLVGKIEPLYLESPEQLRARQGQAVEALFFALLLTGVAMTMAETSFPASGGEHLISHTLDMMSSMDGHRHDLHGRQVGLGTILASELFRRVLATESPRFVAPAEGIDEQFWGPLADSAAGEYARKLPRLHAVRQQLSRGGAWDRLREILSPMVRPPGKLRDCLCRADGAYRAEDIGCSRGRLAAAIRHAHEIRSRFTVLDLGRLLGILPVAADELVEAWA